MLYDGKHKKRINGCENPVAVIRGIEFDKEKFMKKIKFSLKSEMKLKKENAEQASLDILSELCSAKIDLEIGSTSKIFNV